MAIEIQEWTLKSCMLNGLSFDIEDWFHILDCRGSHSFDQWDSLEHHVQEGTSNLLTFLKERNVTATCFILGWVADRYPDLICQIRSAGHVIGTHGYGHQLVSGMTPDEFARDLDLSLNAIYRACGKWPSSYRAPGFSITQQQFWTFDILASRGINLDSSLFIGPHAHGGVHLAQRRPFSIVTHSGRSIIEVPIVCYKMSAWNLPFTGGGYLRAMPKKILPMLLKQHQISSTTTTVYAHSRDFDTRREPHMDIPLRRRLLYNIGRSTIPSKLDFILKSISCSSLDAVASQGTLDQTLHLSGKNAPIEDNMYANTH